MTITTFSQGDIQQDIASTGIFFIDGRYMVLLNSTSKWFKTLNGAKKFATKYGYTC